MKVFSRFQILGAILAAGAGSVSADSIETITTSTPIPLTLTDWGNSIVLPQFNSSLGTLESVTLDFSSTVSTTWTVQNALGASTATHLSAFTDLSLTVEDAGNHFLANTPQINLQTPTFALANLAAGASCTSGVETLSGSSANSYTASSILSEFTGSGNITLDAGTFTMTTETSANGNLTWSQMTDASLTGTVIYDYTACGDPVPDASSAGGLLAVVCGAMPFFRRQRKQAP